MSVAFLVHRKGDDVGVAVVDIAAGTVSTGRYKDHTDAIELLVSEDVPLGHKVALRDLEADQEVVEYGEVIGRATSPIGIGQSVHTHNLKGQRWY